MPFSQPHIRLSFGGTQADGLEIWSCSHALRGGTTFTLNPAGIFATLGGKMEDLGTAVTTFIGDSRTRVPNNAKVKWLKAALIGTDGKYMVGPHMVPLDWGGAINAAYSPQDAMVITLVSNLWRGAGRYNRMYIPTAGPAGSNEWQFSVAEQTAFLGAADTYFSDIAAVLDDPISETPLTPGVVSDVREGSDLPLSELMAGRIVDTQRRRRNALDEDYVIVPWTHTP